jgi:hypothetical protein
MRSYVGVSVDELEALFASNSISIPTLFAPTAEFIATHSELGEEEHEFILSMLAAEESLDLGEAGQGYVLAVEVASQSMGQFHLSGSPAFSWSHQMVKISPGLRLKKSLQCCRVGESNANHRRIYSGKEPTDSIPNLPLA